MNIEHSGNLSIIHTFNIPQDNNRPLSIIELHQGPDGYFAQLSILGDCGRVGRALIAQKLPQQLPFAVIALVAPGLERPNRQSDVSLAVIQRQVDSYPKGPGVKAASAFESVYALYYFDKRLLSKFRSIIGICTYSEYDVIDAILILDYQAFHRPGITLAALLNQDRIVNVDICCFQYRFSRRLDQHWPEKFR